MFSLHKYIHYNIKNEALRDTLLFLWCIIRVFVISAIIAIPLLFILYYAFKYVVLPILMIIGVLITLLLRGSRR